MKLRIVHEDEDVLVIDKPAGLLTSTHPREHRPTLLAMVTTYLERSSPDSRVGLVHRLDRDASGLLVFSKNPNAYHSLKAQFFDHTVKRVYNAAVVGVPHPAQGRIESRLIELTDGSVRAARGKDAGQIAITDYKTVRVSRSNALVRVSLHTGRKHQIRAHLGQLGTPIVNDPIYGKGGKRRGRLMLAATMLSFTHPRTGKSVKFETRLPREISAFVAREEAIGGEV